MDPAAPRRAVRLTLDLHADDMAEVVHTFRELADQAERTEVETTWEMHGGGSRRGFHLHVERDPTVTPEGYQAALRAWVAERRSVRLTEAGE